jgi:hypothetical protein
MLRPGRADRARASVTARCDPHADIYDRYADGLYRQALLTLGDGGLAEQVVSDVIVDECTRVPSSAGGTGDASYRLPVSAYRRCQELAHGPSWHNLPPGRRLSGGLAGCIDPCGLLSWEERGALGLVLFGGLGYVQASHEVAISPLDTAALLRAVLHRLSPSPATGGSSNSPPFESSLYNSRNLLLVSDFLRMLRTDPDSQQPTAATRPGHLVRCPARLHRPALTREGSTRHDRATTTPGRYHHPAAAVS